MPIDAILSSGKYNKPPDEEDVLSAFRIFHGYCPRLVENKGSIRDFFVSWPRGSLFFSTFNLMITIRCTQFDFQMENLSFAQTLYGRWDDFCRLSFEKVLDEVLSRYDDPEMLIELETLTLDLGTLAEADFYEQFPRLLARRLDEVFSAYLANREAHRGEIRVLPIRKSRLEQFAFYLLHGYLSWEEETGGRNVGDFLDQILEEDPEGLLAFLQLHGGKLSVRTRLVFQFSDPELNRLVSLVVPSEGHVIQTFVRFLIESHKRLERPDIRARDYRHVVWNVVWAYLLSESKGYYSRKQFVSYTLLQLAARYNLSFLQLIDLLTSHLHAFVSVRLVIPELLTLLADLRGEEWIRSNQEKIRSERLSLEELLRLLSVAESCRRVLRNQPEPVIYGWVEKIIPFESPFVIGYAKALDEEKEKGGLEGRAGDEFRLVKWEFIFQVLLGEGKDSFNRLAFVYAVLKQLAAHYNLEVGELLTYFYTGLVSGDVRMDNRIRELLIALFLEEADTWKTFTLARFPSRLTETLGNRYLCRHFLHPLAEEKIYKLVEEVIPGESLFIVHYARALDKGKEEEALAGKAGTEFRLLKWEFIFSVLFQAPLSYFSRRQFARSVLQQIAAHYNLRVAELIHFFYDSLQTASALFTSEVRKVFVQLFEEMEKESPELLLTVKARNEWYLAALEALLVRGEESFPAAALEEFVRQTAKETPGILMGMIRRLQQLPLSGFVVKEGGRPHTARIGALLLQLVIRQYGLNFPRQNEVEKELEAVASGRAPGDPAPLQWLLYFCLHQEAGRFQQTVDGWLKKQHKPVSPFLTGHAKVSAGHEAKAIPRRTVSEAGMEKKNEPEWRKASGPEEPVSRPVGGKLSAPLSLHSLSENPEMEDPKRIGDRRETAGMDVARAPGGLWGASLPAVSAIHPAFADGFLSSPAKLSYRWLQQQVTPAGRMVIEEFLWLMEYVGPNIDVAAWLSFFISLTAKTYTYYSGKGLLQLAWEKLQEMSRKEEIDTMRQLIRSHPERLPGLAGIVSASAQTAETESAESSETIPVYIRNAGLILLAPYFPRLFSMLHLLDGGRKLSDPENQVKAIFYMQYLVTAQREVPEYELFLNKLLSGYPLEESFSPFFDFGEAEEQILLSLLNSIKCNWNQMKNTSIEGFRNSFLLREGVLEERQDQWVLAVEPRAYDLLLDTLPWSYSPVKFSWMNKPIYVKWR